MGCKKVFRSTGGKRSVAYMSLKIPLQRENSQGILCSTESLNQPMIDPFSHFMLFALRQTIRLLNPSTTSQNAAYHLPTSNPFPFLSHPQKHTLNPRSIDKVPKTKPPLLLPPFRDSGRIPLLQSSRRARGYRSCTTNLRAKALGLSTSPETLGTLQDVVPGHC